MHDWLDVAVLTKCKNKDGRFAVHGSAGLPFMLDIGDEVALVPPRIDLPRTAEVSEIRELGNGKFEVRFASIEGDVARGLEGMHCLLRRDLIDDELFEGASAAWDGWRVIDAQDGYIGDVCGFVDNPAQSLLEIDIDGREDPVLVPVVDEIITDVDVDAQTVYVALPKGLLDL